MSRAGAECMGRRAAVNRTSGVRVSVLQREVLS
jgi:hypothetical protein